MRASFFAQAVGAFQARFDGLDGVAIVLQPELGVQYAEFRLHLHHGALVIGHEASVRSEVAFQHSGELIAAGQSRQHLVRQFLPLLVQHIQRALAQRALAVAQPHHCILEACSVNLAITASFHAKSPAGTAPAREIIGDAHDARRNSTTVLSELYRASQRRTGKLRRRRPQDARSVPVAGLAAYLVHVGSAVLLVGARGGAVGGKLIGEVDGLDALGCQNDMAVGRSSTMSSAFGEPSSAPSTV